MRIWQLGQTWEQRWPDPLALSWNDLRCFIYERDDARCSYCSTETGPFEVDHVRPKSRGGSNHPDNLALACRHCNRSKKDRLLSEWLQCQ